MPYHDTERVKTQQLQLYRGVLRVLFDKGHGMYCERLLRVGDGRSLIWEGFLNQVDVPM